MVGQKTGRISILTEVCVSRVEAMESEDPVVMFCCYLSGKVAVCCDDRVVVELGELAGLLVGQGGAQGGDAEVGDSFTAR